MPDSASVATAFARRYLVPSKSIIREVLIRVDPAHLAAPCVQAWNVQLGSLKIIDPAVTPEKKVGVQAHRLGNCRFPDGLVAALFGLLARCYGPASQPTIEESYLGAYGIDARIAAARRIRPSHRADIGHTALLVMAI